MTPARARPPSPCPARPRLPRWRQGEGSGRAAKPEGAQPSPCRDVETSWAAKSLQSELTACDPSEERGPLSLVELEDRARTPVLGVPDTDPVRRGRHFDACTTVAV